MTDEAKEARRMYLNEWRRKNPEKVREQKERYWEKKAALLQAKGRQSNGAIPENP